jgi:hypothetical protein
MGYNKPDSSATEDPSEGLYYCEPYCVKRLRGKSCVLDSSLRCTSRGSVYRLGENLLGFSVRISILHRFHDGISVASGAGSIATVISSLAARWVLVLSTASLTAVFLTSSDACAITSLSVCSATPSSEATASEAAACLISGQHCARHCEGVRPRFRFHEQPSALTERFLSCQRDRPPSPPRQVGPAAHSSSRPYAFSFSQGKWSRVVHI